MPSRDSRSAAKDEIRTTGRDVLENICRTIALVGLAALLFVSLHSLLTRPAAEAGGNEVRDALVRRSTNEAPGKVHVTLDSAPTADIRDWIAALPGAGTKSSWHGAVPTAAGVSVEPVVDPSKPLRVWVGAPNGTSIVLRDSV